MNAIQSMNNNDHIYMFPAWVSYIYVHVVMHEMYMYMVFYYSMCIHVVVIHVQHAM